MTQAANSLASRLAQRCSIADSLTVALSSTSLVAAPSTSSRLAVMRTAAMAR